MDNVFYFANVDKQALDIRQSDADLGDGYQLISSDEHDKLYTAINNQCVFFKDLTISTPKPSAYSKLENGVWVDSRTDVQKREDYLATLSPLTQRQFKLVLLQNNLLDKTEAAINAISDSTKKSQINIEYNYASSFERQSDSVLYMVNLLQLTDDQVDQMWQQAMKL